MIINGGSTGCPPIHVSRIIIVTKIQNSIWFNG
jgi:hypothetical protein